MLPDKETLTRPKLNLRIVPIRNWKLIIHEVPQARDGTRKMHLIQNVAGHNFCRSINQFERIFPIRPADAASVADLTK